MPYKDPVKQREAQKLWARDHPAPARVSEYRKSKRALVRAFKDKPCADCGDRHPYYVMDLDHRPDEVKVAEISWFIVNAGVQALLDEMEKCDVVCSNCHRKRTHTRGQSYAGSSANMRS